MPAILAVERGYRKGPFQGDIDIGIDVGVDVDRYFGCLKDASTSVQVLLDFDKPVIASPDRHDEAG